MSTPAHERRTVGRLTGIAYEHPGAFWFGVTAVTAGVLLMLPFFFSSRHNQYHLVGKSPDAAMWIGMVLSMAGIAATAYGLIPRLSEVSRGAVSRIRVRAAQSPQPDGRSAGGLAPAGRDHRDGAGVVPVGMVRGPHRAPGFDPAGRGAVHRHLCLRLHAQLHLELRHVLHHGSRSGRDADHTAPMAGGDG